MQPHYCALTNIFFEMKIIVDHVTLVTLSELQFSMSLAI